MIPPGGEGARGRNVSVDSAYGEEDRLSPEDALLVRDSLTVLRHPAYTSVAAYDKDGADGAHPSVLNLYLAQLGIGYLLANHMQGISVLPKNLQEAHDYFADTKAVTSQIRATNQLHGMIIGAANHAGIPLPDLHKQLRGANNSRLTAPLAHDYFVYCQQGLLGPGGESTNFQHAASRLRALNLFVSFSNDVLETEYSERYASRLMAPVFSISPKSEAAAQELAARYGTGQTTHSDVQQFNAKNRQDLLAVYNRAGQLLLAGSAAGEIYRIPKNLVATRRIGREVITAVATADIQTVSAAAVRLLEQLEQYRTTLETAEDESIEKEIAIAQQLDWEILPPGEVQTIAAEIVASAQKGTATPSVDLKRLLILEQIRQQWGNEKDSYYVRGVRKKRGTVKDQETGMPEADQYLLLILRARNAAGEVIAEHAVAESPITELNAMAVFRQDVAEGLTWQEVMPLPKSYAYALGARAVKHTLPRTAVPENYLVTSMTRKALELLRAPKEIFGQIVFDGDRPYRLHPPK